MILKFLNTKNHILFDLLLFTQTIGLLCLSPPIVNALEVVQTTKNLNSLEEIKKLNQEFRKIYAESKSEVEQNLGPVILIHGGTAKLIFQNKIETVNYVPEEWHVLKTCDHITLALFTLLVHHCDKQLSEKQLEFLNKFQNQIEKAKNEFLAYHYLPARGENQTKVGLEESLETQNRQTKIIQSSLVFIEKVKNNKSVKAKELDSYIKEVSPLVMQNAYDAAGIELGNLHKQIKIWHKELGPQSWQKLKVIIIDGHMPREKERTSQYFMKLLNVSREGDKIIYQEGSDDEAKAHDLLLTHILDKSISESYFADNWRMHKDLLSDGAQKYLKKFPPKL